MKGDWMQTYTGRMFYPLSPEPDQVCLEDIGHALANVCRFGGHTSSFYSVAQHSVLVARLVGTTHPELQANALLHDAPEAYLGDIVRPLKHGHTMFGDMAQGIEARVALAVEKHFALPHAINAHRIVVKAADRRVLMAEARFLMGDPKWAILTAWRQKYGPAWPECIAPWTPLGAESAFMAAATRYGLA